MRTTPTTAAARSRRQMASVLVIVLWVTFGLVSLALYFANTNSLALKASDQRTAGIEADQAIEGAARYASYLLANLQTPGQLPDVQTYLREMVPVGDASFWFIGRDPRQANPNIPYFGLIDEGAKLNINTATLEMLEALPGMTPEVAAAILDWRDTDSDVRQDGAEDETYLRLNPPYHCKNSPFESVEELRHVYGMTFEALFGEDLNRNGVLDLNENDGNATPPLDNHDGRLEPGLVEYVTVYSKESNTLTNGTKRVNITGNGASQRLAPVLQEKLGNDRANQVLRQLGNATFRSPLEFYIRARNGQNGLTADEFALVAPSLTTSDGDTVDGLINVNTASEVVLGCVPGIGTNLASTVVSYRLANPDRLTSVAWVADALDRQNAIEAGRYITAYSYQFTADIAATGHMGRGYRRAQVVIDTTGTAPRFIFRKDLSQLGWALGREVRERQQQQQLSRTLR